MESMIFVSHNEKQACALPSYHKNQCLELHTHTRAHTHILHTLKKTGRKCIKVFRDFSLGNASFVLDSFLFSKFPSINKTNKKIIIKNVINTIKICITLYCCRFAQRKQMAAGPVTFCLLKLEPVTLV